ncbi:MAG: RICIN domain-containing protein [Atopobiaceae bacterium]|nr:RICIN domain-containing protein [Atopobiaceae bacterium]
MKDSSNLEITAKWDPITYTVNFISNYGAGYTGATGTQTFKYGEAQALANPTKFAKPGYKQASWNTKADGQGTTYQLGQSVNNLTTTAGATINLRAIWVVNDTYKVAYDLDGGTLRSDIANPKTGVSWTDGNLLPSVNPTKAGHAFAGWVNKDGSGVNSATVFNTLPECYTDNTKKTAQEPANGAATLTATWIPYTEAPVITTGADLGTATLGVAYSKMFAFAGVPDTGTWSVASGSVPDGLAFDPATAKLSGTPTKVGTYAFELKVDNGTGSTTKRFTLKVAAKTTITTKDIEPGLVDSAYSQQLDATGENVTWSVADGDLPDGITLAADGTLSGTPTEAGSFVFAVTATSATTGYATRIYQLDVYQAPIITTKTIPDMVVGTAVSQQLEATAEPADVSWAITGGSMPTGLKLSEDGLLSGTPTTAGTYTFTVAADNDTGTPGTKSYTVKVQTSAEALYEDDVLGVGGAGAVYTIKSGANTENAVDISAASKDDGANAQVWSDNETPAQRFLVQYHAVQGGKGYYTFKNVSSGKVLDVNGASSESGANVQQYSSNGTVAQQWVLSDLGNGFRKITNAGSGKVLDVSGGSKSSGANLQQYDPNGTAAQAFRLDACKTASEGTFSIVAALAGAPVLDVSGGSNDTCANIQIWTPNGTKAQSFTLAYDATNGYYSITNTGSGKLVDVCGAGSDPGTNVWQYPANGTLAQKWSIVKVASGSYELYSACDGLALDVTGAGSAAGTNVQVFTPNHTVAQSWTLRPIA